MDVALIIPIHKQAINFQRIFNGIMAQTILPKKVYILMDRPRLDIDNSVETISNICSSTSNTVFDIQVIDELPKFMGQTPDDNQEPFLTGHIRNIGIEKAINDSINNYIFIDGDCIPQKTLIESHLKKLTCNIPTLTCGRRREKIYKWRDKREVEASLFNLDLFRDNGLLINNPKLLENSLIVWSCNIGLNISAVKLLKKFNKKYYNREEVFSSEFLGKWGGEDGFLGIEAYYSRIFISTVGEIASGVEHIDHPRPSEKYTIEHMKHFREQCELLRRKVTVSPLTLDFFSN